MEPGGLFALYLQNSIGLHGDIYLSSNYPPPFEVNRIATTSLLCSKNACQQLFALHLRNCKGSGATLTRNPTIESLSKQRFLQQHRHCALKISVNSTSMIFGLPS
jgi:hypothetical protein